MEWLGDLIGGVLSGGATGLFGLGVSAFTSYKKDKEKNRHNEAMVKLNSEAIRAEAELEIEKVYVEGDIQKSIESTKAAAAGLKASYEHDQAAYFKGEQGKVAKFFFGIVDFFRGMIRPSLTIYLVVLTSLMYWSMVELLGTNGISDAQALKIIMMIVTMVLYLTATCITWWFGGRQLEKNGLLSKN